MDIDIAGPSDLYNGQVSVRVYEDDEHGRHWSVVTVRPENARILKAAQSLYKALAMYYDMMTPSDEADEAARHALELAEGKLRPKPLPSQTEPKTCETCDEWPSAISDLFMAFHTSLRKNGDSDYEHRLWMAYKEMPDEMLNHRIDTAVEWSGVLKRLSKSSVSEEDVETIKKALTTGINTVPHIDEPNSMSAFSLCKMFSGALDALNRIAGKEPRHG
jgi:hypothetical protein